MKIEVIQGDITKLEVDAIVNSANKSLLRGGGVDGAIHRAAGKELEEECIKLGSCETGHSKITSAYNLPAKYVIHSVGPVWWGGLKNEHELLASAYKTALQLAKEYNVRTISFPAISCGVYHFPINEAVKIAITTVREFAEKYDCFDKIIFIDLNPEVIQEYKKQFRIYC